MVKGRWWRAGRMSEIWVRCDRLTKIKFGARVDKAKLWAMDNCVTHSLRLFNTHRHTKMGLRVHIDTYIEFLKWVSDHSMQIETLKFWSLDNCSDYLIHIYTLNHESWLIVWHAVVWYFWVHIDNLIWVSDCPINIDTQKYVCLRIF